MQDQKALGFHQKYLNLCSEDERRSYRFEITRGWVINDIIFIFGWTIPLSWDNGQALFNCLILIKKKHYFYSAFVMWNTIMIARYAPFHSNISVEWSFRNGWHDQCIMCFCAHLAVQVCEPRAGMGWALFLPWNDAQPLCTTLGILWPTLAFGWSYFYILEE